MTFISLPLSLFPFSSSLTKTNHFMILRPFSFTPFLLSRRKEDPFIFPFFPPFFFSQQKPPNIGGASIFLCALSPLMISIVRRLRSFSLIIHLTFLLQPPPSSFPFRIHYNRWSYWLKRLPPPSCPVMKCRSSVFSLSSLFSLCSLYW